MSNTTTTLHDVVSAVFPNAEPMWFGGPDPESAEFPWADGHITALIDPSGEDDHYFVSVWPDGLYTRECEGETGVVVVGVPAVMELLNDLTTLQPEGTDWGAWAVQWISDAVADERITGLVGTI